LTKEKWDRLFTAASLTPERWTIRLGLYPFPFSLVFERRLHFVTRLAISAK
jgi:hypothetical protein